jgi:hypothetical protein
MYLSGQQRGHTQSQRPPPPRHSEAFIEGRLGSGFNEGWLPTLGATNGHGVEGSLAGRVLG